MIETHPNGYIDGKAADGGWSKSMLAWLLLGLIAVSVFVLRSEWSWMVNFPDSWVLPFSEWINLFMDWFISNNKAGFRLFAEILTYPMDALRILLSWLPWPSVLIIFCVTAYLAGGL